MTSSGNGNSGPGYAEHPDYEVEIVPTAKRIRAIFGGEAVADSLGAVLVRETAHTPVYYFHRTDVRLDFATKTDHGTYCPFKGNASYWTLNVNGKTVENAVWSYESPYDEVSGIKDYLAFYWDRMDAWLEEDEEVFVHPRDPAVRIDILDSARPVRIELNGETLAKTERALFLFETGLPTRYYVPPEDVRHDLMEASDTRSSCPYKGTASYRSVRFADGLSKDVAWSYPAPLAEVGRIKDRICFFDERVDAVFIDDIRQPKPKTPWSAR